MTDPVETSASRRRIASAGLAVGMLALLAWQVRDHLGELRRLKDVSNIAVAGIVLFFLIARALGGETIRVALSRVGFEITRRISFLLAIVISYTNLFVPRSGLAAPAVYLHLRHDVSYGAYGSAVLAVTLLGSSAVAFCALLLYPLLAGPPRPPLRPDVVLLFAGVLAASTIGLAAPGRVFGLLPERVRTVLYRAHEGWLRIAGSPRTLAHILVLQLGTIALRGLRLQIAFQAVGVPISAADALMVSLCADLGALISLTPAALGFREGALVLGAALVGIDPGAALLPAVVDRLACTLAVVVLGQLFVFRGLNAIALPVRGDDRSD
jgi:uncharacterized membrane protein YbhN (UPF0104 family)